MTLPEIRPRARARRDVEDAIGHYLRTAGPQAALGFVDALERTYGHIALTPQGGSLRFAHELDLPGLRCWPLQRYPYMVFYVPMTDHADVWRVLHGARDIPAWMGDREDDPGP